MDYSTIWDTKTWSEVPACSIAGNKIMVEGGKVVSIETTSCDNVIKIKVEPEIRYRGPIGTTSCGLSNMTINSPIAFKKPDFRIKKIQINPKKNATTVLWEDGTYTVVKKSPGDDPADIWSVVSYALAEKVYGSNSAFKREVKGKVQNLNEKRKP